MLIIQVITLVLLSILALFLWVLLGVALVSIFKFNIANDIKKVDKYTDRVWPLIFTTFFMTMIVFIAATFISA